MAGSTGENDRSRDGERRSTDTETRRGLLYLITAAFGGLSAAASATARASPVGLPSSADDTSADKRTWRRGATRSSIRSIDDKLNERLSINDFASADPSGASDSTDAIVNAIAEAARLGWPVQVDGTYRYSRTLIVPARVMLVGRGGTSARETQYRGRSCLLKDFDGDGCIFMGADSGAEQMQFDSVRGRAGDNVVLRGERSFLDRCSATNAGRDNVRVGSDDEGGNTNLWRLTFMLSVGAGRHGIMISHPTDANGGTLFGCDARLNGGDGVHVDRCRWTSFINPVSQLNKGAGLRFAANARAANVVGGDVEANDGGQGIIEPGAQGIVIDSPSNDVGPWEDRAPPGVNRIRTFEPGLARLVDGDMLAVLNPRKGGTAAVELFAGVGQDNVAAIRGHRGAGTGGVLELFTKPDKDVPRRFLHIDELQRATFDAAIATTMADISPSGAKAIDLSTCGKARIRSSRKTVTITSPVRAKAGQRLTLRIENLTAGEINVSWPADFRLASPRGPRPRTSLALELDFDGEKWFEISRSGDIPL